MAQLGPRFREQAINQLVAKLLLTEALEAELAALRESGYSGWIVVERDGPKIEGKESARVSRERSSYWYCWVWPAVTPSVIAVIRRFGSNP